MIQFNLLPDVKIEYLKARRQRNLVTVVATFAAAAALTVFVLLALFVFVSQKKSINDLTADIKTSSTELKSTPDLTKILTIQNQLKALPGLHDQKVVSGKLFGYMSQITPTTVSISSLNADFALNTLTISGSSNTLDSVNTYVDALKFTKFAVAGTTVQTNAFSEVVLTSFSRVKDSVTYDITVKFDPTIFTSSKDITLTVPQIVSTRSEVDKPSALFQSGGH